MSFLFDPPMLTAAGVLIERTVPHDRRDVAEASVLGVVVGTSFGLYHNVPGLGMLWRPFRARDGHDFMWNSGIFTMATENRGWPMHAAAGGVFATYPLFIKLGRRLGRRRERKAESRP